MAKGLGIGNTTNKRTFGKKKTRRGIHAKTKSSKNVNSKNYSKRYRGQGR